MSSYTTVTDRLQNMSSCRLDAQQPITRMHACQAPVRKLQIDQYISGQHLIPGQPL